jgi:hypothetical protein
VLLLPLLLLVLLLPLLPLLLLTGPVFSRPHIFYTGY